MCWLQYFQSLTCNKYTIQEFLFLFNYHVLHACLCHSLILPLAQIRKSEGTSDCLLLATLDFLIITLSIHYKTRLFHPYSLPVQTGFQDKVGFYISGVVPSMFGCG